VFEVDHGVCIVAHNVVEGCCGLHSSRHDA
jgi:hypothetical protein